MRVSLGVGVSLSCFRLCSTFVVSSEICLSWLLHVIIIYNIVLNFLPTFLLL